MKSENINTIIDESLSSEVKSRILSEQGIQNNTKNGQSLIGKATTSIKDKGLLRSLPSLAIFRDKITNISDIGTDDSFGVLVDMTNISQQEFVSRLGVSSVSEAQSLLIKNLHNEFTKKGLGENSDVDVDMSASESGDGLDMKIKIVAANGGPLGDEMNEDNENMGSNEFLTELHRAKANNEETFTVQGEEYNVEECYKQLEEEEGFSDDDGDAEMNEGGECTECGNQPMEETDESEEFISEKVDLAQTIKQYKAILSKGNQHMNESKTKRVLKLTETEFHSMISKIVSEAVPGLEAVKTAHKGDKRDADEYLNSVDKKMKDYLSFEGNDNPEFPHPIGKGEKVATENTPEEDEYVEDFRGGGMQDLDYDEKPSPEFVKRLKNALEGDTTTGNAQDDKTANVIKSDVGKKMAAATKRKIKIKDEMPMYEKDAQPTKAVNEEEEKQKSLIQEEIQRMKDMSTYNSKTQ
jgi:hypothetical protein